MLNSKNINNLSKMSSYSSNKVKYDVNGDSRLNPLGLFTFLRTYSRRIKADDINSPTETWPQTLERVVDACNDQLNVGFTYEEQNRLFHLLYNLKFSVAGRFLWTLGTPTIEKSGLTSLMNCAFTVIKEPVRSFTWCMTFLLLGSGVGYRLLPTDIEHFPIVKKSQATRHDTSDADFIVPDSREGWVRLLAKTLRCHFYSGKNFSYSCVLLRSKGAPIKGFGGVASGPDILCQGISKINKVLNNRAGMKMRPIDALDIMNIIASIVVAGNVRRSAQIALGSDSDMEFLQAKMWSLGNIPNERAFSNNSIICNDINTIVDNDSFWEPYRTPGVGEPYGLINLDLMKKCGRIGETQYADQTAEGTNPCSEITLSSYETCCLSEVFLPNIDSYEELLEVLKYAYRICKHSLQLPCKDSPETERIVHKNNRIGVGVTGYMQATETQKSWLSNAYKWLRKYDEEYSREHYFPTSIKLTTVKPSGTLSIIGNCTSGIHPGYSQYYIRRIRISTESPLIKIAENNGYYTEFVKRFDGSLDHGTKVVEFPTALPENTVLAENTTAIQQLEVVKRIQTEWSDNSVSVTVTFKPHEVDEIREWLRMNYNDHIKSVSFLPWSGHGFIQAPIEPISKEKYDELIKKCKPIKDVMELKNVEEDETLLAENECKSGMCPIR